MRRVVALLVILGFFAVPAFSAQRDTRRTAPKDDRTDAQKKVDKREERSKDNWPAKREIERAVAKAKYKSKDSVTREFNGGKSAKFIPADISDLNGGEREAGMILGILEIDRETTLLEPGKYGVYARKEGNRWEVYYTNTRDDNKVAHRSLDVQAVDDNADKPRFKQGTSLHYWHLMWGF